jgi:NAD(P)-dependent dehydrogenase (short-subunit alcohol dehydrogenase family)
MSLSVLISGCSSGIGKLAAESAMRAGHHVYATMRDASGRNKSSKQELEKLPQEKQGSIRVLEMDVRNADSVKQAVETVVKERQSIDVVVNNAGIMSIGIAEGFTEEQFLDAMEVNFMGALRVSRAALPYMRANKKGLLIHVTSVVGRVLFPGCAPYCASKFALEALAEILHYELAGTGVESVLVEPGPYPSELLPNSPAPADMDRVNSYGALAALRENFAAHFANLFGSPNPPRTQDVADAIVNLMEAPAGSRPLRTVCGMDFGANGLNQKVAPIQAEVLRALDMQHMIPSVETKHIGPYPAAASA